MNYNVDDIKKEITGQIEQGKALLNAWENVTFPTKKDGTPFANMSKNFEGARYYQKPYAIHGWEKYLSVTGYSNMGGYISDEIMLYQYCVYSDYPKKHEKPENMVDKCYVYDLEDIKEAVKERITYWKQTIEDYQEELKIASDAYHNFEENFKLIIEHLKSDTHYDKNSNLYYMILHSIKDNCLNY